MKQGNIAQNMVQSMATQGNGNSDWRANDDGDVQYGMCAVEVGYKLPGYRQQLGNTPHP